MGGVSNSRSISSRLPVHFRTLKSKIRKTSVQLVVPGASLWRHGVAGPFNYSLRAIAIKGALMRLSKMLVNPMTYSNHDHDSLGRRHPNGTGSTYSRVFSRD